MDVVYDKDGSVGLFLTAGEHGLKLLGDEEEKKGGAKGKGMRSLGACVDMCRCVLTSAFVCKF